MMYRRVLYHTAVGCHKSNKVVKCFYEYLTDLSIEDASIAVFYEPLTNLLCTNSVNLHLHFGSHWYRYHKKVKSKISL